MTPSKEALSFVQLVGLLVALKVHCNWGNNRKILGVFHSVPSHTTISSNDHNTFFPPLSLLEIVRVFTWSEEKFQLHLDQYTRWSLLYLMSLTLCSMKFVTCHETPQSNAWQWCIETQCDIKKTIGRVLTGFDRFWQKSVSRDGQARCRVHVYSGGQVWQKPEDVLLWLFLSSRNSSKAIKWTSWGEERGVRGLRKEENSRRRMRGSGTSQKLQHLPLRSEPAVSSPALTYPSIQSRTGQGVAEGTKPLQWYPYPTLGFPIETLKSKPCWTNSENCRAHHKLC